MKVITAVETNVILDVLIPDSIHGDASEQSLVLAYHFPFPGLGRVTARGQGWEWSPETP